MCTTHANPNDVINSSAAGSITITGRRGTDVIVGSGTGMENGNPILSTARRGGQHFICPLPGRGYGWADPL